jgi:16S rRNA (cytidine1402-2'-O)-methyltransferase
VECLPGATALIPALVQSGLPSDRFFFQGFLPPKKGRQKKMEELAQLAVTVVFYESPHKLLKTLDQMEPIFGGDRKVSISRELTKKFEDTFRGSLSEAQEFYTQQAPKGEFVLCIAPQ